MLLSDFDFELPKELIAQKPSGVRGEDRLMLLDRAGE
ncbi:MAG: S-adenosylmethionine:tRNA ribosyltransferase-isomerase, partial [Treponema sp.]|nr:S-adenosylmethionine:tRNA ribosyltransferase-isomerase [Treponema sp.]